MADNPFPWEQEEPPLPPLTPVEPSPGQPSYGQTSYNEPSQAPSPYAQPQYAQPQYAQPQSAQPQYAPAQYGQPEIAPQDFPPLPEALPLIPLDPQVEEDEEAERRVVSRGGSRWLVWGVPAVAVLMLAVSGVALLRRGPSKAVAELPGPADWTQPLPALPTVPPAVTPDSAPGVRRRARAGSPVRLPLASALDRQVKQMEHLAESNGGTVRGIKSTPSDAQGGAPRQAVGIALTATFPQVVAYLQRLNESLPHALPVSLEMPRDAAMALDAAAPLQAVLTLHCYFAASRASAEASAAGFPGQPELAPALAQMAKAAGNRLVFLSLSVSTAAAPQAAHYIDPTVTLEALATDDEDVERFVSQLSRADRLAEVKLVATSDHTLEGRLFRRCRVEFLVTEPPEGAPPTLNPAAAPPPDVFRLPTVVLRKAPSAPVAPPKPAGTYVPPPAFADPTGLVTSEYSAALKHAQRLRLQACLPGTVKTCLINGVLCKVGDKVEGFTVSDIMAGAVTVKRGDHTFDITLQK